MVSNDIYLAQHSKEGYFSEIQLSDINSQVGSCMCQLQSWLGAGITWLQLELLVLAPGSFSSLCRRAFRWQMAVGQGSKERAALQTSRGLAQHQRCHILLVEARHQSSPDLRGKKSSLLEEPQRHIAENMAVRQRTAFLHQAIRAVGSKENMPLYEEFSITKDSIRIWKCQGFELIL